jgi:hypothetical protein
MSGSHATPSTPHEERRASVADRLLAALEGLLQRHRALALRPELLLLQPELIAAEVAHDPAGPPEIRRMHP